MASVGTVTIDCPLCSDGIQVELEAQRVLLVDGALHTADSATLMVTVTQSAREKIAEHPCFVVTDEDREQLEAYLAELEEARDAFGESDG